MRFQRLAAHRNRIAQIAKLLHAEWAAFPPCVDLPAIEARLPSAAHLCRTTFNLVALSAKNEFLGTASVKRFELLTTARESIGLARCSYRVLSGGRSFGSALKVYVNLIV